MQPVHVALQCLQVCETLVRTVRVRLYPGESFVNLLRELLSPFFRQLLQLLCFRQVVRIKFLSGFGLFLPFLEFSRQIEVVSEKVERGVGNLLLQLFQLVVFLLAVTHAQRHGLRNAALGTADGVVVIHLHVKLQGVAPGQFPVLHVPGERLKNGCTVEAALVHGHPLLAASRTEVDQGGVLQAEVIRRLVTDAQVGRFVHFHTVSGLGHLYDRHRVGLHLNREARRAGIPEPVPVFNLDEVGVVLHHQQLTAQFQTVNNRQRHFFAGLEAQASARQRDVGAHAEPHLGTRQRLNVAAPLLHLFGQACVVGEEIAQHQLPDGRVRHHFQLSGFGGVMAADRLEAHRGLRLEYGVAKDARLQSFHVKRLACLAVAPQANLHVSRQAPFYPRLHVQIAAPRDNRLLRLDRNVHGASRQIRQRLRQHAPGLFEGAGLQAADAGRGQRQHGAPGNAP